MLHLPHHTYLLLERCQPAPARVALLERCQPAPARVREARARRWAIRRRLRELLRVPALRSPLGVHHA
jgi:hypothetical protein